MGNDGLLGSFEEMVLVAVARESGSAYGMTVRRDIQDRTGRDVAIGAVYATLDRLEKKGLVRSRLSDGGPERRGRARRHFTLEPAGAHALANTRRMRSELWDGLSIEQLVAEAQGGE